MPKFKENSVKSQGESKLFRLVMQWIRDYLGLRMRDTRVPTYRHQYQPVCLKKNIYRIQKFGLENVYKFESILVYFGNGVAFGSR